jgi:hypothetical protein
MAIKELNEIALVEINGYEFDKIGKTDEVITRRADWHAFGKFYFPDIFYFLKIRTSQFLSDFKKSGRIFLS